MIIYLDLIFFINFFYDFLILLTVGITLKRNVKLIRYLLSALIGGLSIFVLFLSINEIILFLLKILISIIMMLVAFKYISFNYLVNNTIYFYMISIILAGFLYFLNNLFSLDHKGLIFFYEGFSINYILLLIIAPIVLICYIKMHKKLKETYNDYYKLQIFFGKQKYEIIGFYDNGNNLKDPITGKAVIIVSKKFLSKIYNIRSPIYVPYNTISGSSIMKCFKPSYIIINNHKLYNYLIGESDYKFHDGVDALLNKKMKEDNYV